MKPKIVATFTSIAKNAFFTSAKYPESQTFQDLALSSFISSLVLCLRPPLKVWNLFE